MANDLAGQLAMMITSKWSTTSRRVMQYMTAEAGARGLGLVDHALVIIMGWDLVTHSYLIATIRSVTQVT